MTLFKDKLFSCKESYIARYGAQSEKTIKNKEYVLSHFINSLADDKTCITRADINSWIDSKNICTSTLNGYLCILRDFIDYLHMNGIQAEVPVIRKYSDDYIPYIFSDEEITRIIITADNTISYSRKAGTKTFCMPMIIRILVSCGLRLTETLNLKIEDYDLEKAVLKMHGTTKKKKERYIPLHDSLAEIMCSYISRLKTVFPDTIYLFPQNDGNIPITIKQAEYELNKIFRSANIIYMRTRKFQRGVCGHCFRHYFAVTAYRKMSLAHVSNHIQILSVYLGHENIRETEKYLKFTPELCSDELDLFTSYSSDIYEVL